jgi:hypothetical protein
VKIVWRFAFIRHCWERLVNEVWHTEAKQTGLATHPEPVLVLHPGIKINNQMTKKDAIG